MLTALILRLGSPAFPGTAYMLRHNPEAMPVRLVGADTNADTPERYSVDAFYSVPSSEDSDYPSVVNDICSKERVDVVLVHHDVDALALATTPPTVARLLLSPPAVIATASDKLLLYPFLSERGFAVPEWEVIEEVGQLRSAADRLGYQDQDLALKPAISWGARGFRVVTEKRVDEKQFFAGRGRELTISLDELERTLKGWKRIPKLLLMEYLPGAEYSVDAFCGQSQSFAIPRMRRQIQGGIATETIIEWRQDLIDFTLQAASSLGLQNLFGMQYRFDRQGVPHILECNPRIQGTSIASYFSGVNLIWLGICEALGRPLPPTLTHPITSSYTRRWGGIALSPSGPVWV